MIRLKPVPKTFTTVMAERKLVLPAGKKPRQIRLLVGTPIRDVPTVTGLDWRCPVRITGTPIRMRTLHGFGSDSLQSLVHALKIIQRELAGIEKQSGVRLLWFGLPWHGFPEIRFNSPFGVKAADYKEYKKREAAKKKREQAPTEK